MAHSHPRVVTLLSAIVLCLYLPAVLGTPFIVTDRREEESQNNQQQFTLQKVDSHGSAGKNGYHDDPLKDFISDVVHDIGSMSSGSDRNNKHGDKNDNGRTLVPVTPPVSLPLPSSPPPSITSLRYTGHVDGLDDITIGLNRIAGSAEPPSIDNDNEVESTLRRPSWFDSVLMARRLLAKSSVGIASTVYQHSDSSSSSYHAPGPAGLQGVSISLPEYIADCSEIDSSDDDNNGNPILLGLYVSTTFRNIAKGSNISLSIDWWSHLKDTNPLYPGFPLSEAGLPRISLLGYVEKLDLSAASSSTLKEGLEECFFAIHPDAKVWAPGNPDSPHSGFWARMVVTQVYWIGGFGDLQQIGWMNITDWKGVGRYESDESIGDGSGRGWENVKLPGE